ncbi:MAG: hypothetical protein EOP24_32060 [Hyphomicrobiales bacterium]|nr:MAG: hypothetical protein EOP24_32060 [Hyphomicrobiales bacterium]
MTTPARLQRDLEALTRLADGDVQDLLRRFDVLAARNDGGRALRDALNDVLPALVESYGLAAASIAADWYDEVREANEIRGRFQAIVDEVPDLGTPALVGWAEKRALSYESFGSLVSGGVTKRVINQSRSVVMRSSIADPRASGWMRVAKPNACPFCAMLSGRGFVYKESTVDFYVHDSCGCLPAPNFPGRKPPVDPSAVRRALDERDPNAADVSRAREFIAANL